MAEPLADILRQAAALHDRGDLREARRLLKLVLRKQPGQFAALHLLGIIEAQRGNPERAEALLSDAVRANPGSAEVRANLGKVQQALGMFAAALASYDQALQIKPNYPNALNSRGTVLAALGRHQEAVDQYGRALAIEPRFVGALHNRAIALRAMGRLTEALADCERALAIDPKFAAGHAERGRLLFESDRIEPALEAYDRSLALDPRSAETLYDRGIVLLKLQKFDNAITSFDKALEIDPTFIAALINRGNCFQKLNRPQEALASYQAALALKPDLAEALECRGAAQIDLGQLDEALASFDQAIAVSPELASAYYNRGGALVMMRRADEALASFDRAIALKPEFPSALWNRGLAKLLVGRYREGWEDHEWRWKSEQMLAGQRGFMQPQWDGRVDIAGQTILLHAEQGLGDTIMATRYVPRVTETGARVLLEVQAPLVSLLAEIGGVAQIIAKGAELPPFDIHCPMMSLPRAFDTVLENIPAEVPYLSVPRAHVAKWQQRVPQTGAARIGVCWAGNVTHRNDRNRSIALAELLPLFLKSGTQVFGLQKDLRDGDAVLLRNHPAIVDLSEDIQTFADTAAIISTLDLVISVDTSTAHLAGALAKPVWVLLPFVGDWRWLLDREDSPWYPTARLFRQPSRNDWRSVVEKIASELDTFVSKRGSKAATAAAGLEK